MIRKDEWHLDWDSVLYGAVLMVIAQIVIYFVYHNLTNTPPEITCICAGVMLG